MIYKTLKIYFTLLLLIVTNNFYSQLNISWKLDSKKENADIVIYNNSNENIAVALDTLSLQGYFNDNHIISKENWTKNYPFLALTLNIYDGNKNKLITNTSNPHYDLSEFQKVKDKRDSLEKEYNSIIKKWKVKNKIKKDRIAQINYYLVKNLLLIKPKDSIKFSVIFNLRNITNTENNLLDSYILENDNKYSSFLTINVDKSIEKYLTKEQKQKLKNYVFFTGRIESNKIELQH
jgi:hypothetical protein